MDIKEIKQGIETGNHEYDNSLESQEEDSLTTLSRQGQAPRTKKTKQRRVSFPADGYLVSKLVEPVDPWANASNATSAEVIKAYMHSCARLRIKPIDRLVKQLKEHNVFQSRISILDLKGIKLDLKSCEALEEIFKRVQVHTLDIENTNLEDEGAIAIVEMIEFYQSAVHICIGYNPRIKTRGWQIFSQMIRKAPFIEFIDLRHCCFSDPCTAVMARSLKLNSTLRILHLEGDNLSGKLLLILCTGIKFNESITELFLGDNFLVSSDASTLSAMLKSNGSLQLLDVRNNMLQDQGVLHLCDGLAQQRSSGVKTLVLWNNQITRHGTVPVANLLASTQNIQTLNIGHNRLGNDGIRSLQLGLLKNRSLLRLGLLNTKITAEGAVALAEYVADTRTLLRLDLRENDLFVGGLMALTLAVKINETVVRIDLDKDLKKEQGMEGTQTSLLVDIYQYLERNKKLGIEREEFRRKQQEDELQRLTEEKKQNTVDGDAKSRDGITKIDVVTLGDELIQVDAAGGKICDKTNEIRENKDVKLNASFDKKCSNDNDVDVVSSRFVVSRVRDHHDGKFGKDNEVEEDVNNDILNNVVDYENVNNILTDNEIEGAKTNSSVDDETNKHANKELSDKSEEISDSEDFEKTLDELLTNVSGVTIDLPEQDDEEFWSKDVKEIFQSTAR